MLLVKIMYLIYQKQMALLYKERVKTSNNEASREHLVNWFIYNLKLKKKIREVGRGLFGGFLCMLHGYIVGTRGLQSL